MAKRITTMRKKTDKLGLTPVDFVPSLEKLGISRSTFYLDLDRDINDIQLGRLKTYSKVLGIDLLPSTPTRSSSGTKSSTNLLNII